MREPLFVYGVVMELVKVGRVAKVLRTKEQTIYQLVRRGIIPPGVAIHLGRQVQFDLDALKDWLRRGGTSAEGTNMSG